MSKVLISFLGTGRLDPNADSSRTYSKVKYSFNEGDSHETSFFALALKQHYGIEKMILIGTPKSMWEEVYLASAGDNLDESVYESIAEYCSCANVDTPASNPIPCQQELENAMGGGSKVVLVNYGLIPEDMEGNSRKVLSVEQYLNSNDEVYVDITHSFRSLPLMLMNTLVYLKNNSRLNIKIQAVSYGMLDVVNEMESVKGERFAPVVRLDSVMRMNDWISAASAFKETADAYKLAELMKAEDGGTSADFDIAKKLVAFSDVMNMNYVAAVADQVAILKKMNFDGVSDYARMIVVPVVKELVKSLDGIESQAEMAFRLAEYQLKKKKYSSAAICATEAFILKTCEKTDLFTTNGTGKNDKVTKQIAQDIIFGNTSGKATVGMVKKFEGTFPDRKSRWDFKSAYDKINEVRKEIAHSISGKQSVSTMISTIEASIKFLRERCFS